MIQGVVTNGDTGPAITWLTHFWVMLDRPDWGQIVGYGFHDLQRRAFSHGDEVNFRNSLKLVRKSVK